MAEVPCGAAHITGRKLGPDSARREHFARLRDRRNHRYPEAVLAAGGPHRLWIAAAALAEEEVVPDDHVADAQRPDQYLLDELRRREIRQVGVEREHDGEIEPEALE